MAKAAKAKTAKTKISWLRLALELIVVFIGVSAGYYTISNQKMEFVHTLDSLNRDLKNSLETLLTLE